MKDQKISQKTKKGTTPSPTQEVDLKLGEGVAPTPSRIRGRFGGEKNIFLGCQSENWQIGECEKMEGGHIDAQLPGRCQTWGEDCAVAGLVPERGPRDTCVEKDTKDPLCFVDIGLCMRTYMDVCVRAHWCGCGCGCVGPSTHPSRADQPFQAVFVGRKNRPENDFWQFFGSQTSCKMPFVVEFCQKKYIIWGILGHFGGWDFDKQFLDQLNSPFGQPSKPDPMNPGG